ncbi:MAG TPA: choice-of-anchor tandem repeat GloVer-containing protein [Rhizomicrobium sp.]|nr:choice-of-anchor tandem repeat GloVer-containing protein [Rhizomicrobium sp.]
MKNLSVALLAGVIACLVPAGVAAKTKPGNLTVLHSFGGDGDGVYPEASLLYLNGTLYGTTNGGGTATDGHGCGCGTVFALDPVTDAEHVVYSFCARRKCVDGSPPISSLVAVKGTLYGTTRWGGVYDAGTVFAVDPKTGKERVLHSFAAGQDGASPYGTLIDVEGTLYGTTQAGGSSWDGTAYSIDPQTGAEKVLYSFCSQPACSDGARPEASLTNVHGELYGTTYNGGNTGCNGYGCGTIFALDRVSGAETVIHALAGRKDGEFPATGLTHFKGILYGTTLYGGANRLPYGTVFSVDPKSGAETVLHSFCNVGNCRDGRFPEAGLVAFGGVLYGTTALGGDGGNCDDENCGTIFAVDPNTGAETVLHAFCRQNMRCADGAYPEAGLIVVNGTLYGTTGEGGARLLYGTVFAISP